MCIQGRIQDLIRGAPDRDRPKTAILGPQFCRILVLGPHFWWSGGARAPPGSAPGIACKVEGLDVNTVPMPVIYCKVTGGRGWLN